MMLELLGDLTRIAAEEFSQRYSRIERKINWFKNSKMHIFSSKL